jgi:hypothetical protein
MSGPQPEPELPVQLIRADPETLRWNFPGPATIRAVQSQLLRPEPASVEIQERNRSRGSLFDALVDTIVAKLTDQPCYVELSGGCDSSLVLSAAVVACQRAQHEPPVSMTFRFPLVPEMDESEYQDAVLGFLGLAPGLTFQITNEFDLLGPSAQKGLKIFGPVCPAPIFSHVDLLRTLPPGLLLSGEGGDEVLGPRRIAGITRAIGAAKQGQVRAVAGNLLNVLGPKQLRRARLRRRQLTQSIDWIDSDEVTRALTEGFQWNVNEPLWPKRFPPHYLKSEGAQFGFHQLTEVRRWTGHRFFAPLMDPNFVQAVADLTPIFTPRDRRTVLNHHFARNLPDLVLNRTSKAVFQPVYFNTYSKEFARSWSGQTSDPLVNGPNLQRYLLQDDVHQIYNLVFLLLQQAWLESEKITLSQPIG